MAQPEHGDLSPSSFIPPTLSPGDNVRLATLLQTWEQHFARGQDVSAADLCRDCPHLTELLTSEITRLKQRRQPSPQPPGDGYPELPGFRILGVLGEGGMGIVYAGEDLTLNRPVAIKVLRPTLGGRADLERRFLAEVQICGQLQHPGIVPVHQLGKLADGRPFFVMKLVKGKTLADLLERRPDPAQDLQGFLLSFQQVCQALAYAHSHGVIHRDLKPANVMVGKFREIQVMDWGLAKVVGESEPSSETTELGSMIQTAREEGAEGWTRKDTVLGTLAYMPPEQAAGRVEQLDRRSDVFSLGAILCVILTGRPPYVGPTAEVIRRLALTGDLADALARLTACGADPELVALTRACLAALPEDRPPDARAVADAVSAYLTGVQEKLRQAELERAAVALRSAEERKRRRLTAILTAVGVAAVLVAGVSWRWVEQTRDAYRARNAEHVNHELGRAASLRDQARALALTDPERRKESARLWGETLAVAGKAEAALAEAPAGAATRQLVEELVPALRAEAADVARDRDMVERLEAAHDLRAALTNDDLNRTNPKAVIVYGHAAAEGYEAAFRVYGIDVLGMEPAEAARQIRGRSIRLRLADALDDWLALEVDRPVARRLLSVARDADPDPFRNRLREAVAGGDRAALKELARASAGADLPVPATLLLADGLHLAGELGEAVEVLRRAQRLHPDDLWVNDVLGVFLFALDPSRAEEAARYFTAALALRPTCFPVHDNLGDVLTWQCRWQEAGQAFQASIRLKGDFLKARVGFAEALARQGDLDRAIAICQEVVERDPRFAYARFTLAMFRLEKGEKTEALAQARELVRQAADVPLAHVGLGHLLLQHGREQDALAAYRQALKLNPEILAAHLGLVQAYLRVGDYEGALETLQKASRRNPNSPDVWLSFSALYARQKKWPDALDACRRAVFLRPAYWQNHLTLGDLLCSAGTVEEAIAAYQEALRLKPDSALIHNKLGMAWDKKGEGDKAIAAYREAIRLRPQEAVFHNNIGHTLSRKGQPAEALVAFQRAAALEPGNARYQASVGQGLDEIGQRDLAIAALRKAIELEPANAAHHAALGLVLRNKGDLKEAGEALSQAVRLKPNEASYWQDLGDVLCRKQDYQAAAAAHREAVQSAPDRAMAHASLGHDLLLQRKYGEATEAFQQALRLKPDYAWAYNELGMACLEQGDFERACAAWRQALLLKPTDTILLDNLGQALLLQGRAEEAVAVFQKAVPDRQGTTAPAAKPTAYAHLGRALCEAGRFQEAVAALEKCQVLLTSSGGEEAGSLATAIGLCQRLAALEAKRKEVLAGTARPATPAERLDFARFCHWTHQPALAVVHFSQAFSESPSLAGHSGVRVTAALAAALAASESEGEDPVRPRRLALEWLRAELTDLWKDETNNGPADRTMVRRTLQGWQHNPALAGLRDRQALANLPAAERTEWRKLWADVAAQLKAGEKEK